MAVQAQAQLLLGHLGGDFGGPEPGNLDLQQVEDIAIQNQLDLGVLPAAPVVVLEKLGKTIVVEEVFERIQLSLRHPCSEMQVADHQANQLHGKLGSARLRLSS